MAFVVRIISFTKYHYLVGRVKIADCKLYCVTAKEHI